MVSLEALFSSELERERGQVQLEAYWHARFRTRRTGLLNVLGSSATLGEGDCAVAFSYAKERDVA